MRRPAELPSAGRSVQLQLRVRRFSCPNTKCTHRTFAERLPGLLAPRARRTSRSSNSRSARCTASPASTCCAVACCSPLNPTPHIKCGRATKSGQPQVQASGAKRSSCKVRPEKRRARNRWRISTTFRALVSAHSDSFEPAAFGSGGHRPHGAMGVACVVAVGPCPARLSARMVNV
ncbi:hypothetical protein [Myxococcus sp. NMCA1]|uniref:hypothetical protein n=1 Tax=Myxococcus sp. NMCA1 TaxID=2996785 RepID=UPI003FA56308